MARLQLTVCTGPYDRVRALTDGRVAIEGCEVNYLTMNPEQIFHRAWNHAEFDVTELSASSYILARSTGWDDYIGVPVFPSRSFRHSGIYIRRDAGISGPSDLKGREVGVPVYSQTASLWVRGMLSDDYGVAASDIHWRTGGLEQGGRKSRFASRLSPDVRATPIGDDETLSSMLADGRIPALVSAREPSCFGPQNPDVVRLFPNFRKAERDWYARTGMFPIMHVIAIRKSLADANPWLATSVAKAFDEAKRICFRELADVTALAVSLPWLSAEFADTRELMGEDFWSYGFEENRRELETMCRWSAEQGIAAQAMDPAELFHPATLDRARI